MVSYAPPTILTTCFEYPIRIIKKPSYLCEKICFSIYRPLAILLYPMCVLFFKWNFKFIKTNQYWRVFIYQVSPSFVTEIKCNTKKLIETIFKIEDWEWVKCILAFIHKISSLHMSSITLYNYTFTVWPINIVLVTWLKWNRIWLNI